MSNNNRHAAPSPAAERRGLVLDINGLKVGSGAPKIVTSITATHPADAIAKAQTIAACAAVDIAELRIDHQHEVADVAKMVELVNATITALQGKPLLVTFRSRAEGGQQSLSDRQYATLYCAILENAPIDLLDIEMMKPQPEVNDLVGAAHQRGVAVILSNHELGMTPASTVIVERLRRQQAMGADILKIAVMPQTPSDVLTLMSASEQMFRQYAQRPLLTMAMGPLGVVSRLAGRLSGSALTFASLGERSAPGQVDAYALRSAMTLIDPAIDG